MSKKDETISKLRKELRDIKKAIRIKCTECNYDLKHDCKIKKCALYQFFKTIVLESPLTHQYCNSEKIAIYKTKKKWYADSVQFRSVYIYYVYNI